MWIKKTKQVWLLFDFASSSAYLLPSSCLLQPNFLRVCVDNTSISFNFLFIALHNLDLILLNGFVIQSLSPVKLFLTPRTATLQASLSFTISWSLLKLMSTESMMPSNHLIPLSPPSPPALNLSQHQGLFQWVGCLHQVAKVLELQLQHQSFQWISRVDFL